MKIQLKPADVFMTQGDSWISKAIRIFTRHFGESRTQVNHVGVVVKGGDLETALVVEAVLPKVAMNNFWEKYGPPCKDRVAIYRPLNLGPEQIATIVDEAKEQVDKAYGIPYIITHWLDYFLLGAYVFRRLTPGDSYPICSWVVAHAFSKVDAHFGVSPGQAQPDDIWDFVTYRKDYYECLWPLSRLEE
jgi:hypothetical protein